MEGVRLKRTVPIFGTDLYGCKARVLLEPIKESSGARGWEVWVNDKSIPITAQHLKLVGDELELCVDTVTLRYALHLLALRHLIGLQAVRIIVDGPLPFCGSAKLFLGRVCASLEPCGALTPCALPLVQVGERTSAIVVKRRLPELYISALISARELGIKSIKWDYHSSIPAFVKKVGYARMRGRSRLEPFARLASTLPGRLYWPHYNEFVWPHEHEENALLDEVARHRILDILGALSCVVPPGRHFTGLVYADNIRALHTLAFAHAVSSALQTAPL